MATMSHPSAKPWPEPTTLRMTRKERAAILKEIPRLYGAGHSIRDMARRFHRSYGAIHALTTQAGVEKRPKGGRRRAPAPEPQ